jgi:hypothetical protein
MTSRNFEFMHMIFFATGKKNMAIVHYEPIY